LPKSIDEIKRTKIKQVGQKESEFIIGTRFMLNWIDEKKLHPFLKKSGTVYQTRYFDKRGEPFVHQLRFEVTEDEA